MVYQSIQKLLRLIGNLFSNQELAFLRESFRIYRETTDAQISHLKFLLDQERIEKQGLLENIHRFMGLIHENQVSIQANSQPINPRDRMSNAVRTLEDRERIKAETAWRKYADENAAQILSDADDVLVVD